MAISEQVKVEAEKSGNKQIHQLAKTEVFRSMNTSEQGLSDEAALATVSGRKRASRSFWSFCPTLSV